MKISRRSWHYRLLRKLYMDVPDNLCAYFWKTVFVLLLIPAVIVSVCAVVFVALVPAIVFGAYLLGFPYYGDPVVISVIVGLVEVFILGCILREQIQTRTAFDPPRPPSLVREYLMAKKQKVCPMIEVVS